MQRNCKRCLGNIIGSVEGSAGGGLNIERPIEKVLIAITSDRGLYAWGF